MSDQWLVTIDRLKHQELADLRRAPPVGRHYSSRERFTLLMQHPDELLYERPEPRRCARVQHRRNERVLEHDLFVGSTLNQMGQWDARVGLGEVAREKESRAQRAHFEQGAVSGRRGDIARLPLPHVVPDQTISACCPTDFCGIGAARRYRQVDNLVANLGPDVDWCGKGIVIRHSERRPVWKHAGGATQRELADAQQVALELDFGEPPAMRDKSLASSFDEPLEVAILLLEVLGLEEQPLGPDDLVMSRHSRIRGALKS